MSDLKRLRERREEILKAELAAWLHDVGKCADAFLQSDGMGFNAQNCSGNPRVNPHKAVFSPSALRNLPYWSSLSPQRGQCSRLEEACHSTALWKTLKQLNVRIPIINVQMKNCGNGSLKELILWGRPLVSNRYNNFKRSIGSDLTYLAGILGRSHSSAHMEKEDEAGGGQSSGYSSPFGWFIKDFSNLNDKLQEIINVSHQFLQKRENFLRTFKRKSKTAPGDTRRPINEVTLWDWSSIVAALYKAEIARCILTSDKRGPEKVQWRLLSIRTDGLGYLFSAVSITDLKARQELLKDAWDKVQKLLEEDYPLALEVYRDENGLVFVVPDVDNLLGLTDSDYNAKTLREFILECFRQGTVQNDPCLALQGEIVPEFSLDKDPWDGQSKLPLIGNHLKETPVLQSDPQWVSAQWCDLPKPQGRCTVCGLRPQGPSDKARDRKMCDVCEKRRGDRAERWATKEPHTTIWLDEVADQNGRMALLVGTFDLTHWLDGTLVRSLAVRNPENVSDKTKTEDVAKNPSFARLRRIWETTRKFWEETLEEAKSALLQRPRIFLKGSLKGDTLGPYHAYELEVQGRKVAVLWVPENATEEEGKPLEYRGGFWVIENLKYLDNIYGASFRAIVESLQGQPLRVYEPSEYGWPGEPRATFTIASEQDVRYLEGNYTPLIPILAEPRTFMALVPADKAFEIVRAIKAKYEREMGKVRNRLPLHLGVVFADAHQPLRTILDAGRRMLEQGWSNKLWEVVCPARKFIKKNDKLPERFGEDKDGQFREWFEVFIKQREHNLTWYVPAVMGDGQTEDQWYPYVFLAQDAEPSERGRYFPAPNSWNSNHKWLVHVAKLEPGDVIYFTPATLDFHWLATGGDRFTVAYDEAGKRRGMPRRPYLLDEIDTLEEIWQTLKRHLTESQIHALRELIETKREEWLGSEEEDDQVFRRFCRDVLANTKWRGEPWTTYGEYESWLDLWADYAVKGWFADAVEVFHGVMKERSEVAE